MTSPNTDRLDRIEATIESNAKAIQALGASAAEESDRLRNLIESNAKAIQALGASAAEERDRNRQEFNLLAETAGRTLGAIEGLREIVEEDRINFQEFRDRNDANLVSLNAAVERLEAIVAYLVRRDGENQA